MRVCALFVLWDLWWGARGTGLGLQGECRCYAAGCGAFYGAWAWGVGACGSGARGGGSLPWGAVGLAVRVAR